MLLDHQLPGQKFDLWSDMLLCLVALGSKAFFLSSLRFLWIAPMLDISSVKTSFRKSYFAQHHYCISVVNSFLTLRLRCVISRTISESCPSSLYLPEARWIFNLLYCICLGAVVGMVVIEKWLVTCHCYLRLAVVGLFSTFE